MEAISDFIVNNYLWFLIIAIVLLLALIGYFVDVKLNGVDSPYRNKQKKIVKKDTSIDLNAVENVENISLNSAVNKMQNQSLTDVLNSVNEENNSSFDSNSQTNINDTEML